MLLSRPDVQLNQYLAATKQVLGRSIVARTDSKGLDPKTPKGFLCTLIDLKLDTGAFDTVLKDPASLLYHLSYSFLVLGSKELGYELMENTKLKVMTTDVNHSVCIAVASGDLSIWRETIINCASEVYSFELRTCIDKTLLIFEKEGLSSIWSHYQKETLRDHSFKLIEKK